ncbi:unnamed protein product [Mortierella alpina]
MRRGTVTVHTFPCILYKSLEDTFVVLSFCFSPFSNFFPQLLSTLITAVFLFSTCLLKTATKMTSETLSIPLASMVVPNRISYSGSQDIHVETLQDDSKSSPEAGTKTDPKRDSEVASAKDPESSDSAPGTPRDKPAFHAITTLPKDTLKRRDLLIPYLLHAVLVANMFSILNDEENYEFGNKRNVVLGFFYVFFSYLVLFTLPIIVHIFGLKVPVYSSPLFVCMVLADIIIFACLGNVCSVYFYFGFAKSPTTTERFNILFTAVVNFGINVAAIIPVIFRMALSVDGVRRLFAT